MMKALSFVTIVILLGAVLLGFNLPKRDPLDNAKAHRMEVETAALAARHEIELEALPARLAREADLHEFAVLFGLAVFAVATLVLSVALAYYLVCRGNALRAGQLVASEKPGLRLLEFPSPDKRKRKQAQGSSYGWPDEAA